MKNIKSCRIYYLYDVDILFLSITEKHGSRMFEERELSKIQVIGDEKMVLKLSNQEGKTDEAFRIFTQRFGRKIQRKTVTWKAWT